MKEEDNDLPRKVKFLGHSPFDAPFSYNKGNIFQAISNGSIEDVKSIIKRDKSCLLEVNRDKYHPLQVAILIGNEEIAKLLIEEGAPIRGNPDTKSTIMIANDHDHPLLVCLIMEKVVEMDTSGLYDSIDPDIIECFKDHRIIMRSKRNKFY